VLIPRYYHGPTPIQSLQYATSQDIINSFQSIRQEMEAYTPKLTQVSDFYCFTARVLVATTSGCKHSQLNCMAEYLLWGFFLFVYLFGFCFFWFWGFFCFVLVWFFETGFLCVVLAVLELTL
jgi:hypothetical protein